MPVNNSEGSPKGSFSRRNFLKAAGSAAVLPALPGVAAKARASQSTSTGSFKANSKINLGCIGMGWQGPGDTEGFLASDDCRVMAVCDVDKNHLAAAAKQVNDHYDATDCETYHDFRELLANPEIDAVLIAVPDHWHSLVAIEAAKHGKDIYGEKPLGKTIAEQQAMVRAVEANNVIWQMGSWQRSEAPFQKAAEIVRNGLIGRVTRVEVGLPAGWADFSGDGKVALGELATAFPGSNITSLSQVVEGTPQFDKLVTAPPPELDYDFWIGPSQMEPYIKARLHKDWRWNYNTGGGQLMDWIGHHCDIAHWGLGYDRVGPLTIEGTGTLPSHKAVWNTSPKYRFELKYPNDITMIIAGGDPQINSGAKWIGTEGWVRVDRGVFEGSNPEWKKYKNLPRELRKVKLYTSRNHQQNFLDCIKTRQETITPIQTGHNSAIPGHLCQISMVLGGRKIHWNYKEEKIVGDAEASKLLGREFRGPWKLS